MAADTPSLEDLRREIDDIDVDLQDLLIRRAAIAEAIGKAKGENRVFIRPGREAQVVRHLLERHRGNFPKVAMVRIWREIIAALTALQGPFTVAVYAPDGRQDLKYLARFHYGSITPLTAYESAAGVLRAVSEGTATLGVLPLPQNDDEDPWWRVLARGGDEQPRVVARLPFAALPHLANGGEALAVAVMAPEESGDDRSFLVVETTEQISRGMLMGWLDKAGIAVHEIMHWEDEPEQRLHLVEAEGFLAADDERLAALQAAALEEIHQVWTIGGYAEPFSEAELARGQAGGGS